MCIFVYTWCHGRCWWVAIQLAYHHVDDVNTHGVEHATVLDLSCAVVYIRRSRIDTWDSMNDKRTGIIVA